MAVRFWEIYEATRKKYKLRILAGKNGMDNVIGWVHMLEDETIVSRFGGEELAVTTGMKASQQDWLLHLVMQMKQADCAGIIVNTGMYLHQIPEDVICWCEAHDFPLLVMPWEITITQLVQDYCLRIILKQRQEQQEGIMFERLLRGKEVPRDFLEEIGSRYDLEGTFRVFCMYPYYSPEEKLLFRQATLKLENVFGIWQNSRKISFPYFMADMREFYVLAVNNCPEELVSGLTEQIRQLYSYFFERNQIFLGIGPSCQGIHQLKKALGRARIAMKMARDMKKPVISFDEMGIYGILFSTEDPDILREYADRMLGSLEEYDRKHFPKHKAHPDSGMVSGGTSQEPAGSAAFPSVYVETLRSYIENDRSLIGVARATYTHRNTVNYRIQNIKKILGSELQTTAELLPYQIAFYIRDMGL